VLELLDDRDRYVRLCMSAFADSERRHTWRVVAARLAAVLEEAAQA
jgi:glycosyltransferase involved in cell wall biosynthesis